MTQIKAPWCAVLFLLVYLLWAGWLTQYPLQITSDDALNFSRAVERFSVLEFRPHFPGYPAFVGFSRVAAIWGDAKTANVMVSLLAAIAIPLLVAWLIYQLSGSWSVASLGGLLVLVQPLIASVALSGLSDSLALVFLLLALLSGFKQQNTLAGLCIGLMLATRPSYFPLAMGCIFIPLLSACTGSKIRAYIHASISILIVGLLSLAFIWSKDGLAYLYEGIRFTQGHFAVWGNTVGGDDSSIVQWVVALIQTYSVIGFGLMIVSMLAGLLALRKPMAEKPDSGQKGTISIIGSVYLIWVFIAQNPDNLRHWTPVVVLFSVLFPMQLHLYFQHQRWRKQASMLAAGTLVYFSGMGWHNTNIQIVQAPTQQAIDWIKQRPEIQIVGTNYSVNLLREQLKNRSVYDMYYPSSKLALQNSVRPAWRLSGSQFNDQQLITQFPARFTGERQLYLYIPK